MEFRSFKEFREHYFPNLCEKERTENMSAEEYGPYIASKLADEFRSYLEK